MKILILLLFAMSVISAQAPATADSLLFKWEPRGVAGINLSQVSFKNWSQGGDNSLSYVLKGEFGLQYRAVKWMLKNNLKLAYGRTKLGEDDYRTNDNELYLESVFAYSIGWAIDPFISNTIRSDISAGYNYKDTPYVRIANFFDPGYVTQSIGFTYDRNKNIITRLGLAFQETFTNKFRQYSDDPETKNKIEAFKFETGIESVTDFNVKLDDNLFYTSKLRLFTRFNHIDVWDVRWDNTITAQVNKYINVNFNVLTNYEKSQSPLTQVKEALMVGLTYNFF